MFDEYVLPKTEYVKGTSKKHRKTVVLYCGTLDRIFFFLPFLKYSFSSSLFLFSLCH